MEALQTAAGWVAPIATMLAAMVTAANLGPRPTGYGFVVFMVGSVSWLIVAAATGQQNLLWTNGLLTLVNAVGIWRWLGRQARYQEGSQSAEMRSARKSSPTLVAASALQGMKVIDAQGAAVGSVVETMLQDEDGRIAYLVVTVGGVGGLGERLHALNLDEVEIGEEAVTARLSGATLNDRPALEKGAWPASANEVRSRSARFVGRKGQNGTLQ